MLKHCQCRIAALNNISSISSQCRLGRPNLLDLDPVHNASFSTSNRSELEFKIKMTFALKVHNFKPYFKPITEYYVFSHSVATWQGAAPRRIGAAIRCWAEWAELGLQARHWDG